MFIYAISSPPDPPLNAWRPPSVGWANPALRGGPAFVCAGLRCPGRAMVTVFRAGCHRAGTEAIELTNTLTAAIAGQGVDGQNVATPLSSMLRPSGLAYAWWRAFAAGLGL